MKATVNTNQHNHLWVLSKHIPFFFFFFSKLASLNQTWHWVLLTANDILWIQRSIPASEKAHQKSAHFQKYKPSWEAIPACRAHTVWASLATTQPSHSRYRGIPGSLWSSHQMLKNRRCINNFCERMETPLDSQKVLGKNSFKNTVLLKLVTLEYSEF